jgi:hypothetical protein
VSQQCKGHCSETGIEERPSQGSRIAYVDPSSRFCKCGIVARLDETLSCRTDIAVLFLTGRILNAHSNSDFR